MIPPLSVFWTWYERQRKVSFARINLKGRNCEKGSLYFCWARTLSHQKFFECPNELVKNNAFYCFMQIMLPFSAAGRCRELYIIYYIEERELLFAAVHVNKPPLKKNK